MNTSDFTFDLPPELIAQTPIGRRERSRLMCLDKQTGETQHRHFYELPELLCAGDCLVLNDTRVLPARLRGRREAAGVGAGGSAGQTPGAGGHAGQAHGAGGHAGQTPGVGDHMGQAPGAGGHAGQAQGAAIEVVLLRDLGDDVWECLTKPGRKTKPGTRLSFGGGELSALVVDAADGGNKLIKFSYKGVFLEVLERLGRMPLPPYIHEEPEDPERYQTVYSHAIGSAAAPTAGLHFTVELLDKLEAAGVRLCYVTLHVGLGTFRPVRAAKIEEHKMHSEFYIMPDETADVINRTKEEGGRVIAVGTTSCRTLESCADSDGKVTAASGFTDIFIYPGYRFKCVDALVTNFHLPESTLIMLVSALAGRENILSAYGEAIREQYRFFSFGDAMLIV